MNWKEYEKATHQYFKNRFPNATITHDVKLTGKLSKIERQIDVLIEESICGYKVRFAIECKDWNKPLDIGDVEQFVGKLNDIGVDKGIMVSRSGYSKAAKELSYSYSNLNLHVFKFEELENYQAFMGLPYRGRFGIVAYPPNGWFLQSKVPPEMRSSIICSFYPMDMDLNSAIEQKNVIFLDIPFFKMDEELIGDDYLNKFIDYDQKSIYEYDKDAAIKYSDIVISNRNVKLRETYYVKDDYYETAVILHFYNFLVFIFGAHNLKNKTEILDNIEFIVKFLVPIELKGVDPSNSHEAWSEVLINEFDAKNIVVHINDIV